jgi:ATP-dependent Lhr-like helicase
VIHGGDRWFAVDGPTDPKKILLGRLESLGPVHESDPRIAMNGEEKSLLLALEHDGAILRTRLDGREAWCERRLLARIHRYTIETLRSQIQPVTASEFMQFLGCWQHVDEQHMLEGPRGVAEVLTQLAGFEAPAIAWERDILPRRVRDYRREWLDQLTASGEFVWGRLWGGAGSAIRVTPISFVPREQLDEWISLASVSESETLSGPGRDLLAALKQHGPTFPQNLPKIARLVPAHVEMALSDLVAHGLITCDSFGALRQMITPPSRRRRALRPFGRWCTFRSEGAKSESDQSNETVARQLLKRTGVVFRRTIEREKLPARWSTLVRTYRRMELRGEIRGGRFVGGFSGEQYALPEAIEQLRQTRRQGPRELVAVTKFDPLDFSGILTPADPVQQIELKTSRTLDSSPV